MATIKANILGVKQAQAALAEIAKDLSNNQQVNLYRKPMKSALEPLENRVKDMTPVEEGNLLDSVTSVVRKPNKKDKQNQDVTDDTVIVGKVGWFRKTGDITTYKNMLSVEFGNKDKLPTPVLRPTFKSLSENARSIFSREFGAAVNKRVKQINRKRNKGKKK